MALAKINFNVTLTEINCGECGGTYAINERYRQQQYEKGGSWTCPYCKTGWGYSENNENSRLKAEKEKLERRLTLEKNRREVAEGEAQRQSHLARGQKAAKTRLKNRIKNGVCPCCNRTFQNLAQHIKGQHPEFVDAPNPGAAQ